VLEPQTRRLLALLLTRAAAGLGGALAGIGLVHIAIAGNPWGIPLLAIGLVMLLQGIRHAARLGNRLD
jgi:hypothetical protein